MVVPTLLQSVLTLRLASLRRVLTRTVSVAAVRGIGKTEYDYGRDHGKIDTIPVWKTSVMDTNSDTSGGSRTMKASEFKAKCLQLMDEVAESGGEIVITKNGKPLSRLVPYRQRPKSFFGADRGRITIVGDIISPIDVEWEAETNPDRVLNP